MRFSKQKMSLYIQQQMKNLEHDYGFSESDGWSVVKNEPIETIVAFGQYDALRSMLEEVWS